MLAFQSGSLIDREFWRKAWQLTLPTALHCMMFALMGLSDVLMVSHLGENAIAAVGLGNRIFTFNLLISMGLAGVVSVLAAQYVGARDAGGIRSCLLLALLSSVSVILPFVILYALFPAQVIGLATSEPELAVAAISYLSITSWSLLATPLVLPLEAALRATGDATRATQVGILSIVVNLILNGLLIFGLLGFPAMGLEGAAWATTLSRAIQTLVLCAFVLRCRPQLVARAADWRRAFSQGERRRFTAIALPLLLKNSGWGLGALCYSLIIAQLGATALAVMSLIGPIELILLSLFSGLGIACATMLGHELGASRFQHAWQQCWAFLGASITMAAVLCLLLLVAREAIASSMGNLPPETLAMVQQALAVIAIGICLKVINMVGINGVLQSGGDVRYATFIDLFGMWAIGIPLALLATMLWQWPLPWILAIILVEEVVKIVLTVRRIRQKYWLSNLTQ